MKKHTASDAARILGQIGGLVSSPAKTAAVRANGKKGGRPKSKPARKKTKK